MQSTRNGNINFRKMDITFNLDPKFSVPQTEVLELKQLLTIDGHEVMLSEVELSPLVISARFIYEPEKILILNPE